MVFAITENAIMMNHAVAYTFDRLKVVALMAYLIALIGIRELPKITFSYTLIGSAVGFCYFFLKYVHHDPDHLAKKDFRDLGIAIRENCRPDELPFYKGSVRGSLLYYARRNIVEIGTDVESDVAMAIRKESAKLGYTKAKYFQHDDNHRLIVTPFEFENTEKNRRSD